MATVQGDRWAMRRMPDWPVLALVACVIGASAGADAAPVAVLHDGPFGIAMGESLRDLGPVRLLSPGSYEVLSPLKRDATFPRVFVTLYPSTGVCQIDGNAPHLTGDIQGIQLRQILDGVAESLKAKYGPYIKTDTCTASNEECSEFWVGKLSEGVKQYNYDWEFKDNQPAGGFNELALSAMAKNSIESYPLISYFSANEAACDAAAKAARASSL